MGRRSFETVLNFASWPYGELPVTVMSRSGIGIPDHLNHTVATSSATPAQLVDDLYARGLRNLYIDGGETIRSFLEACLIDDLTITTIPVLLGSGRPLFGPATRDIPLTMVSSRGWDWGFVQTRYRIDR